MYLPGYYVGGKISPALQAKTKIGGYVAVIVGNLLFFTYLLQLLINFSLENLMLLVPMGICVLLIVVGIKFIKTKSHNEIMITKKELDNVVLDIEVFLISVVQGVTLTFLVTNASDPISN